MSPHNDSTIISRRNFLRTLGAAGISASILACKRKAGIDSHEISSSASQSSSNAGTGPMTMRENPSSGYRVSILGYGCMRLPETTDASGEKIIDQEQVNHLTDYAIEHGINYFDTSPVYCKGKSEHAMGIALSRHPRNTYYIATKLSNFAPATWPREESIKMYRNSLKELRTDYIDYLLLHAIGQGGMESWNNRYIDNGILDFLIAERSKGKIRNLGFSYHGDIEVFDHLLEMHDKEEVKWDFAQIQLNYLDWHHAKEINPRNTDAEYLYNELHRRGIPAVIMEPLLGGRLATANDHVLEEFKRRRPDDSVAAWAFRFAGTPEGVLTVLSGMTYMEHLKDNIRTYSSLEPCTPDELSMLSNAADYIVKFPTVPCTACQYCMPCPYGLDIPAIFAHYNKCINEGRVPTSSQDPEYATLRRAFLIGYDRAVPRLRQANHCIGCNECVKHCPQSIYIPGEMQKIDAYVEQLKQGTL